MAQMIETSRNDIGTAICLDCKNVFNPSSATDLCPVCGSDRIAYSLEY